MRARRQARRQDSCPTTGAGNESGADDQLPGRPPRRTRRQFPQGATLRQFTTASLTDWVPVVP